MRTIKAETPHKLCPECKGEFLPASAYQEMCQACINRFSRCDACGMVVSDRYGYWETALVEVGKKKVCGTCYGWLTKEGFLWIQNNLLLLSDGSLVRGQEAIEVCERESAKKHVRRR